MKIKRAEIEDLSSIVEIYNQAIRVGGQTADLDEFQIKDKQDWFQTHQNSIYAIFVILVDEQIAGWLSLSPYRNGRKALQKTAEISYYLDMRYQSKGLGSQLMKFGIEQARALYFESLIAILLSSNKKSIGILKKFGFSEWGRMPQIAEIRNEKLDHLYYGLRV